MMALAIGLPSACDAVVGPAYVGEPIAALQLHLAPSNTGEQLPAMELALVWQNRLTPVVAITDRHRFEGALPSGFELLIATPPSDALMNDFTFGGRFADETRVAVAAIVAMRVGDTTDAGNPMWYGVNAGHVVLWVDRDVVAGTYSEAFLGGRLARGFHLAKVVHAEQYVAAHPEVTACDALETECVEPTLAMDVEGQFAFDSCMMAARQAAQCPWPMSVLDRLMPADRGFSEMTQVGVSAMQPRLDWPAPL